MRETKTVYATTYKLNENLNREYESFANRNITIDSSEGSNEKTKDFGCQYDKNTICTCKRIKRKEIRYYSSSRQVYRSQRYSSARGFTDIGVGNVKTLTRKRVRRIYLPETVDTGIGSSDLTPLFVKTKNLSESYYDQKKTSSKCIGGVMDCTNISVISEKLSPIIQTISGSNSPKVISIENVNDASALTNEPKCSKTDNIETRASENIITNTKQKEVMATLTDKAPKNKDNSKNFNENVSTFVNKAKSITVKANIEEKDFSSDSLIQHVHNLENPSEYKQSRISIDFIENKLEREYRRIFSSKPKERKPTDDKAVTDFKSASTLRRRFEALRRGISKKNETDLVTVKVSSRVSVQSKKDVSIVSDPPSLEARSYSNTKMFSPFPSIVSPIKKNKCIPQADTSTKKSSTGKKLPSPNWSTDVVDSDCQGVKGMFKLWGKKFNLEEDNYDKGSPVYSKNITKEKGKKDDIVVPREEVVIKEKREGKRFSFFKKRSKDKSKPSYKSRKGVTAGRCEVEGLMIKIGAANEYPPEPPLKKSYREPEDVNDILRKTWLKRFLSTKVDSKHSAQIRWNNNMYTTSSSTVFELIDCIYKNTDIIFRSKSEMTTEASSFYQSFTSPQINFMHQSIQAWMIPKTTRDNPMIFSNTKKESKNIEVRYSNQKWFIEKSKAFARKIELVLHSKNIVKQDDKNSSDYIMINIPEGYFSDTSSNDEDTIQTSDEQVYNIVEYETVNSNSYSKQKKDNKMETGDHVSNEIQVTVSVKDSKDKESNILETVIKRPPLQRDVIVQGSNVYIPKRCDVIGVGIITQRDIRDIKKPILRIQDDLTDSEHILPPQKKCEFAESYLQDYYRNWTPLGIDLFSWCVSDSHLRGSSEINSLNSLNQGDGSKSCPNIYDDYQASTIVSSCNTSSCSHCLNIENEKKAEEQKKKTLFAKLKKKSDSANIGSDTKRVLPKDSIEVFRRRKIYALSNKGVWATMDSALEPPCCVPSIEDKCEQRSSNECPVLVTSRCKSEGKQKKGCQKHVSMQNCDDMDELLQEQLSDKVAEGILTFKGAGGCEYCKKNDTPPKRARVIPEPTCEIPQPPCLDSCTKKRKPACSKKNSPSCHKPPPPVCPAGFPSPCQDPCLPISPPCPISPCPLSKPPSPPSPTCSFHKYPANRTKLPRCSPPSPPCSRPKLIPPKVHSPPPMDSPQRPCVCPPRKSPCDSPECPVEKWSSNISHRSRKHSSSKLSPPCTPPQPACHPPQPACPPPQPARHPPQPACPPPQSACPPPQPACPPPQLACPPPQPACPPPQLACPPPQPACPPPQPACPPSRPKTKCKECASQEFPWPLKNQMSNTPSKESIRSNKKSPKTSPKAKVSNKISSGIKGLIQKLSGSSIKDCRPDCANRSKMPKCPQIQQPKEPKVCRSRSKMPGLHLKKLPMPKCPSKECLSWGDDNEGVIRLNSKERITIKLRKGTASTEEIREGCNMKAQDEDGQTLYERRDYQKCNNKDHLVQDMYRDSQIQRVETSNADMLVEKVSKNNISSSIPNIIEINLSLKFKQGDKNKMNLNNCSETHKNLQNMTEAQHESSKEVYHIRDQPRPLNSKTENKDLDIKIVIKNYKQHSTKSQNNKKYCANLAADDVFSKKISEKFHTVSTGYSDVLEQQTFSIHRTTVNLTNSNEINNVQGNPKKVIGSDQFIENNQINDQQPDRMVIKPSTTLNTLSSMVMDHLKNEDEIPFSIKSNSIFPIKVNSDKIDETNYERSETGLSSTDNEDAIMSDVKHESNEIILPKIHKKEEKKEILKQIFESAHNIKNKGENSKMKNIRKMLRAVLTSDSSAHEDIALNNKLANELTYASLKPNYFKNSESMTNYYLYDSSTSINKESNTDVEDILYPTRGNNSESSCESNKNKYVGCLCSQFAAKLNIKENKNGCCCRSDKRDKEIVCNIIDKNYYKCETQYVDVETQDSKCIGKCEANVTNLSVILNDQEAEDKFKDEKSKHYKLKMFSPHSNTIKACQMKRINRSTILGLSDDDKVVILNSNTEISFTECLKAKRMRAADILQSPETKKAVLEIYAEKTISSKGERMVSRLPKFVYDKESEISHYQEILTDCSKRNIVMMSIT